MLLDFWISFLVLHRQNVDSNSRKVNFKLPQPQSLYLKNKQANKNKTKQKQKQKKHTQKFKINTKK